MNAAAPRAATRGDVPAERPPLHVLIVTPASADSRSGNRHTAARWCRLLGELGHTVSVAQTWTGERVDVLFALHALKSHASIAAFRAAYPDRPIVLALTGTDLYRDVRVDARAAQSIDWAHRLIVLQDEALNELQPAQRAKAMVIYQSVPPLTPAAPRADGHFDVAVIGHLREEKDPFRCADALRLLPAADRLRVWHFGGAMSETLAREAQAWMDRDARYRWLGSLPHETVLTRLAAMDMMVISSRMEGGATVVSEALAVGVPVLASAIPGNVGMLGAGYAGYFPVEDSGALARLLMRAMDEPGFVETLAGQMRARQPLIAPARERDALARTLALARHATADDAMADVRTDADSPRKETAGGGVTDEANARRLIEGPHARRVTGATSAQRVTAWLQASRARTLALLTDLDDTQWLGPRLPTVNPPLWELGHLAWFQELWCLRQGRIDGVPSRLAEADRLYDSARIAHARRWDLPLPTRRQTLDYARHVLAAVTQALGGAPSERGDEARGDYFFRLAVFHEDMHGEAFAYARQTLGYAPPHAACAPATGGALPGDVALPGGAFMLGAPRGPDFVFDNEKWAHPVQVRPFAIARAPVTEADYAAFVDDAGYARRQWWSDAGWAWLQSTGLHAPVYWHRQAAGWMVRHFDAFAPLAPHRPVMHVNAFEAEAYCRWARRRLPTEAEWEMAAATAPGLPLTSKTAYPWGDAEPRSDHAALDGRCAAPAEVGALPHGDSAWGCRQMLGNVWEWTASAFLPYPGYEVDPYREYSQPWFGSHRVLRGGSFATPSRLLRNTWRNFYTPDRNDIFAGFRTCAIDADDQA